MDLTLPKSLSIQDIDLMCIYSNLLDNAIESCQRSPSSDDLIKIKTSQIGNYLGIKITNSKRSNLSQQISASGYDTTKKDKSMHGYGLRIIDEIVKRYDGYKELQDSNVEFSAMVMLKLMPAMEDAIAAL
jgi:sensor histidine kinase regulating citrate/malate metabolism